MSAPTETIEYHWVISLTSSRGGALWEHGTFDAEPGYTRHQALSLIKENVTRRHPLFDGSCVVFFSFEPNQL